MHGVGIHFSDQGSPTGKANMDTLLIHVHIIIEAQFPEYQSYRHQHPNFPFLYIMPCLEWVQHSQTLPKLTSAHSSLTHISNMISKVAISYNMG